MSTSGHTRKKIEEKNTTDSVRLKEKKERRVQLREDTYERRGSQRRKGALLEGLITLENNNTSKGKEEMEEMTEYEESSYVRLGQETGSTMTQRKRNQNSGKRLREEFIDPMKKVMEQEAENEHRGK